MAGVYPKDGDALIHPPSHDLHTLYQPQQLGAQLHWNAKGPLTGSIPRQEGRPMRSDLHILIHYDVIFYIKIGHDIGGTCLCR